MTQAPLDHLCQQLTSEFRRDPRGTGVARLLADYAREHQDWNDFACFDSQNYTRNLVHRDRDYELLLLCWREGHESPIHNHEQQSCWMAVLDGSLEELHFQAPGSKPSPLTPGRTQRLSRGEVAYIEDGIALHLVRPQAGAGGVSLHLYSKPIDQCRVFDPSTGESASIEMGYHSVRGERCLRPADEVRAEFSAC